MKAVDLLARARMARSTGQICSQRIKIIQDRSREPCHSYNQAAACTQHVDAAIGMNRSIGDTAARVFSSQFYSAIGFGKSVPVAFEQARNALMLEGIPESSTPVLYLREGVEADDLILVKPREKLRSAL